MTMIAGNFAKDYLIMEECKLTSSVELGARISDFGIGSSILAI